MSTYGKAFMAASDRAINTGEAKWVGVAKASWHLLTRREKQNNRTLQVRYLAIADLRGFAK